MCVYYTHYLLGCVYGNITFDVPNSTNTTIVGGNYNSPKYDLFLIHSLDLSVLRINSRWNYTNKKPFWAYLKRNPLFVVISTLIKAVKFYYEKLKSLTSRPI